MKKTENPGKSRKTGSKSVKTVLRSVARNKTEAAKLLNCTRQTVTNYQKAGAPGFKPNGTIDIVQVETWRAVHANRKDEPPDLTIARTRLLTAQAIKAERANLRSEKMTMSTDEAFAVLAEICNVFWTRLGRWVEIDLPPVMAGLDPKGVFGVLQKHFADLKEEMQLKFAELKKQHANETQTEIAKTEIEDANTRSGVAVQSSGGDDTATTGA